MSTDDRAIAAEDARPEVEAEHDWRSRRRMNLVLLRREQSTSDRLNAEQGKQPARHVRHRDTRPIVADDTIACCRVPLDARCTLDRGSEILEVRETEHSPVMHGLRWSRFPSVYSEESAWVRNAGRRLKEQSVEYGERRHVPGDADQDAEGNSRRERRRPSKAANRVGDVLTKRVGSNRYRISHMRSLLTRGSSAS